MLVIPDWLRQKLAREIQNLRDKAEHYEHDQREKQQEADDLKAAIESYRSQADDIQRMLEGAVTAPAINTMSTQEFDKAISQSIDRTERRMGRLWKDRP